MNDPTRAQSWWGHSRPPPQLFLQLSVWGSTICPGGVEPPTPLTNPALYNYELNECVVNERGSW